MRKKKIRWPVLSTAIVFAVLYLVLTLISELNIASYRDQSVVKKWSNKGGYAQVSCFFHYGENADDNTILAAHYGLIDSLTQEAIAPANENAKLFLDCYSGIGNVGIRHDHSYGSFQAYGVKGDFFFFHEYSFVDGTYFSPSDMMDDYLVVDEEVAWKLFGAKKVAGMTVEIGGVPFIIKGVIKRPSGKLERAAGFENPTVILPASALQKYGSFDGYSTYEICMPNPVKNFAVNQLKKVLGQTTIVQNTGRYGLFPMVKLFFNRSTRSMVTEPVCYPYWENVARAHEDSMATLTVSRLFCLLVVLVIVIGFLVALYRNRTWHKDDVRRLLERLRDRIGQWGSALLHKIKHSKKEEEIENEE